MKKYPVIKSTKNYSMFKFRNDNRDIKPQRVIKLLKSMKENGWSAGSYVIINQRGEVIDGQGRIMAAKTLGLEIPYITIPNAGLKQIQELNQGGTNWSKEDYINSWSSKGEKNYQILKQFSEEFPDFNTTEHIMFLMNGFVQTDTYSFQSGKFKVNNVELGRQWGNYVMMMKPLFPKGYNKSIFVRAMVKVLSTKPEFIFEEFYKKAVKFPFLFQLQQNTNSYIDMIERIYNYSRRNNEKISLRTVR